MTARGRTARRVLALWLPLLLAAACETPRSSPEPAPLRPIGAAPPPSVMPVLPYTGARPDTVVLVTVAGMTPRHYRTDGGLSPAMPFVAQLAAGGVSADAVEGVTPATKYPAHATLLTGLRPADHGVVADLLMGPAGIRDDRHWHASHLNATPLWQLTTQQGRGVAALGWPSTLGASIPLLLPDVVPMRPEQAWLDVLGNATTPSVLSMAQQSGGASPGTNETGPERDAVLARVACSVLALPQVPGLLLLHLSQTEAAIVTHGPDAPETRRAFGVADREVGRLVGCLQEIGRLGSTALVVVGDHGTVSVHTLIAPNAVLLEEGLLKRSAVGTGLRSWRALARSNGGTAFVYAQNDEAALRARRGLSAAAERTGAFRVVPAKEMLGLGADPAAWFGLEAEPGFAFSNAYESRLLRPAALRGVGGYLPTRGAMDTGFVAWGRGLRSGIRVPAMRQTDVAPTLAELLGVEFPDAVEGRALVGVLSLAR